MKQKTHKALSKRIKITKTGKIKRRSAYISHLMRKKRNSRKKRHQKDQNIVVADRKNVRNLLPNL